MIDWMMKEFNSEYVQDWNKERFSLRRSVICDFYPEADLNVIFFWKVYAQGWLARKSGPVFSTLAKRAGNGGKMIEKLAEIPDSDVPRLKSAWEKNSLPKEVYEAFTWGRGGWRVLGYAVNAAKKLVSQYGNGEPSYISSWLSEFLCDTRDDEKDLVDAINLQVEEEVIRKSGIDPYTLAYTLAMNARYFLVQRLVNSEAHLLGVGSETISFFFRDWMDVALWKYMWKHDYQNERFWRLASEILGSTIELRSNEMDSVLNFLSFLTPEEIDDGIIAKINTTAYRFLTIEGEGEEPLRRKLEEIKLDLIRGEH